MEVEHEAVHPGGSCRNPRRHGGGHRHLGPVQPHGDGFLDHQGVAPAVVRGRGRDADDEPHRRRRQPRVSRLGGVPQAGREPVVHHPEERRRRAVVARLQLNRPDGGGGAAAEEHDGDRGAGGVIVQGLGGGRDEEHDGQRAGGCHRAIPHRRDEAGLHQAIPHRCLLQSRLRLVRQRYYWILIP